MQTVMPTGAAEALLGGSKVDELKALYRLTDALYRAQSQEEVYEAALEAITGTLGCSRASILLFDQAGTMRFVAWRGLSEGYRIALEGHSPWKPGTPAPEPIFVRDIDETDEPEAVKAVIRAEGIRGLGFMPIVAEGVVVGKFMTYHEMPHEFAAREIDLALTISRQVGFSIERWQADIARRLAEADLRASEARFRLMAEHAPVMIWMSKPDGSCLHLNRRLREFWDVPEDGVEAFDWNETIHPDDLDEVVGTVAAAIAERRPFTHTARFRSVAGAYRTFYTEARPRFTPRGEFLGMIGVNVDTTERVRAEEALRASEARFRTVVEAAPSAMLITDGGGRITLVNANAEALFGYRRDELIGRGIGTLLPLGFVEGRAMLRGGALAETGPASGRPEQELVGLRKDGTEVPVEIGLSRIETEEGVMTIASVDDISARKRTEAQRELLLAELKHRVRNTLAVVQGIAHQTFKGVASPEIRAAFEGRLAALAAAHRLLTEENREGAWLAQLAEDACEAAGPFAGRVDTAGPAVFLPAKEALALALALHELFTNAVKYGALSNETGRVALRWDTGEAALRLVWEERDGPKVAPPSRQGFGCFLLHKMLARDLNGRVEIRYLPEGLVCSIEAPLPHAPGGGAGDGKERRA